MDDLGPPFQETAIWGYTYQTWINKPQTAVELRVVPFEYHIITMVY